MVTCPVTVPHWVAELEELVERHAAETGSKMAIDLLQHWDAELVHFLQICPKEMLVHLPHPIQLDAAALPAEISEIEKGRLRNLAQALPRLWPICRIDDLN